MIGANIDVERTVSKTSDFLQKDLHMLACMADRDVASLSSPQLSWAPSHTNGKNHQQDMIIDHWAAEAAMRAVHEASQHIPNIDNERDIFILYYFKKYTNYQLAKKYVISLSTLKRRKQRALVEFALRLDVQKQKKQHQCDWLDSLVVKG